MPLRDTLRHPLLIPGLLLLIGVLLVALVVVLLFPRSSIPTLQGRAVTITDGDTFTLDTGAQRLKIRLSEIDTPEMDQPYGVQVKQQLSEMISNKTVQVQSIGQDKYRRTLGRVYVNGLDINAELVRQGAAWVYRQYSHDPQLPVLEEQARAAQRGLWADTEPCPPWDWRHHSETCRRVLPPGCLPDKRTCKAMSTCEEARFYLTTCGLGGLDRDKDGVPCEKLCR